MNWLHRNHEFNPHPADVDAIITSNVALAKRLNPDDRELLMAYSVSLVSEKRWEPIAPLELTSEVALTIAANAVIPILGLDLSISWNAALADSRRPDRGRNVVIHEFSHKIDMADGYTDGTPPLRGSELTNWTRVLADEFEHADVRPGDDALRPYAWSNVAEFFAVATETFFCTPVRLAEAKPELYAALRRYFNQDPASWVDTT